MTCNIADHPYWRTDEAAELKFATMASHVETTKPSISSTITSRKYIVEPTNYQIKLFHLDFVSTYNKPTI